MTAPAAPRAFEHMRDLPRDMQELLRVIDANGPASVTELAYLCDVTALKSKCLRLVAAGLAIGNKHPGENRTIYTVTGRGSRFVNPPGMIVPPRTRPYTGTYVPEQSASWRPGQDHFLRIPSVGSRT